MPVAVHGGTGEGIVLRDRAVRRQSEYLARQTIQILSVAAIARIACGRVQHAIRSEGDAAAVVVARRRYPRKNQLLPAQRQGARLALDALAHNSIVLISGHIGIEIAVMRRDAKQTAFAGVRRAAKRTDFTRLP